MQDTNVIDKYFSKELTYILDYIIENVHNEMGFTEISPCVFLYSALEKEESMLYTVLSGYLISEMIDEIHDKLIEKWQKIEDSYPKSRGREKPELSKELRTYLNDSLQEVRDTNSELINSDHVLLSILREAENTNTENEISKIFREYRVTYNILLNLSKNLHNAIKESEAKQNNDNNETSVIDQKSDNGLAQEFKNLENNLKILDNLTNGKGAKVIISGAEIPKEQLLNMLGINKMPVEIGSKNPNGKNKNIPFCINLNEQAKNGKFDELVGRENELEEIFNVLARRKTNNAILVGEGGVGKTQIIIGLVQAILSSDAPFILKDKEVWKFNPTEMLAGTTLRGMFEERMVGMIKALKDSKNAILFIDDIHNLFAEKSKGDFDAGGVISELLSNGDVQVICTCDFKGYKNMSDNFPTMTKKLQKITIDPLSEEDTYKILLENKKYYEDYHCVEYSDKILKLCISLAKRYITDKTLPSSAIEIMDELGSYTKINSDLAQKIKWAYRDLNDIKTAIDDVSKKDNFEKVTEYKRYEYDIRCSLAKMEDEIREKKKIATTEDGLYKTISKHTNIPIGKLKIDEKRDLKNISDKLKSIVIGQDDAINAVSRAIKRNKVGLHQGKKPIFSGFFCGQTGTGKTILAKTLAKEIFGDEKYLVRFDMSEYNDKTSVNKLIGASAGYVGYNEGGLLTEAVKRNKYCVLLIDEIEKATVEIFNLFLQVLDEGFLTDNIGQKVDFSNTMIIFTSNVGTKKATEHKSIGFNTSDDETSKKQNIITKEMKDKFPPEFLNRIDEIIFFNNLTDDNLREIIKLELDKLNERLTKINQAMFCNQEVIDFILKDIQKEKEYGARPIIRSIRDNIENKITDLIIDNDYLDHIFYIEVDNNKNEIKVK